MKRYIWPDCELCNLQLLSCRPALAENIHSRDFPSYLTTCRKRALYGRRDQSEVSKWGGKV